MSLYQNTEDRKHWRKYGRRAGLAVSIGATPNGDAKGII